MTDSVSPDDSPMKRCSTCKQFFPTTSVYFTVDRTTPDLLRNRCRQCFNTARRLARRTPKPPKLPEGYKRCAKCQEVKPATPEYFSVHNRSKDHLDYWCKECLSTSRRKVREVLPEGFKRCTKCREIKPATTEYFFNDKKDKCYGLSYWCKVCVKQYVKTRPVKQVDAKTCRVCGQTYPATAEYFHRGAAWLNGIVSTCKDCDNKRTVLRNSGKRVQINQRQSQWRHSNRAHSNAQARGYYEKHKGRWLPQRRLHQSTPEFRQYKRRYRYLHRDNYRAHISRRRALVMSAGGTYTGQDVQIQLERQKGKCYWCGKKFTGYYEVDHIRPLSRDGSNGPDNLVLACRYCNRSRSNRLPHEWPQGGKLL